MQKNENKKFPKFSLFFVIIFASLIYQGIRQSNLKSDNEDKEIFEIASEYQKSLNVKKNWKKVVLDEVDNKRISMELWYSSSPSQTQIVSDTKNIALNLVDKMVKSGNDSRIKNFIEEITISVSAYGFEDGIAKTHQVTYGRARYTGYDDKLIFIAPE